MLGYRTAIGVSGVVWALAFVVGGCGGTMTRDDGSDEPRGRAGRGGAQGTGSAGASAGRGGTASVAGAESAGAGLVDPEPVNTGCTDSELPPPEIGCDAFDPNSCGPGLGCYPFVDHPNGTGCDQQRYGTTCLPAGQLTQGQLCGESDSEWCAPGFVCVVGQRAGKRCAALCKLGAASSCSGGLLCSDLDVAGFGVCG